MSTVATASGPTPDRAGQANAAASGPPTSRRSVTPDAAGSRWETSGRVALIVVVLAWIVILGAMLSRRVFISHDSLSNNVHVWFISEQLWHGRGIPFHMPVLASGTAYTFPYSSIPWTVTALLWPLFKDWSVTLVLVLGFVATVWATFWALPSLRKGWWAAATLVNPSLVISPLLGQLPFLWAMAAFTFAIGFWRRGRVAWAVALTAVAQIIHPAVMMPIVGVIIVLWLPFEQAGRRLKLVGWWAVTVVVSLPRCGWSCSPRWWPRPVGPLSSQPWARPPVCDCSSC